MSKMNGLSVVANKSPIVATHMGLFDLINLPNTLSRYEGEAATHVQSAVIGQYQQQLISAICGKQTPIGCLVAPFGYGKTSTAINIWHHAAQANILAVPPFSCNSISEMGTAIASALSLQLADKAPELAGNIRNAYQAYLASSATRLAQQDAEQYGIDFGAALKSIEDKIERGYLHIEANATNLLAFLEKAVSIVKLAGYDGLLIIVDEFQQFLGNVNKAIITSFRTLIWGLKTRPALPLGLLLTMDPDTERNLSERAGDVLHRIKENGFYLNFTNVYDREFPRLLWSRYADIFDFQTKSEQIVDRPVLEALGQITERADLSNGPRTILDAFQRMATVYDGRKRPYTPLDLIDDFMTGMLKFDGDRNLLSSLVTELTGYDYIKRSPERVSTIKLITAFPRGCPREVAAKYKLEDVFDHLSDELRGEILTELPEGVALIDLQRVGKPQNKLKIILKKYWLQITEQELIVDKATNLFAHHVIPPLFPQFKNVLTGWRELNPSFILTPFGGYLQIYEGTFFREYPLRRIAIQICQTLEQATSLENEADVGLIFLLKFEKDASFASTYHDKQRLIVLHIPVNCPFVRSLPRDIRWIEDYLRPVTLTPGVLLSLIDFVTEQAPQIQDATETEMLRIHDTLNKLQEFLVTTIFGQELLNGTGIHLMSRGSQAMRDILFHIFRTIYPAYQTMVATVNWQDTMQSYKDVLTSLSVTQRRGIEEFKENKATVAAHFWQGKHAGFKSHARQFGDLLEITAWQGNEGALRFRKHPGEDLIQEAIILQDGLSLEGVKQIGRIAGYLSQETEYLISFLLLRGYIRWDERAGKYFSTKALSEAELTILIHDIQRELLLTSIISNEIAISKYQAIDLTIKHLLGNDDPPEEMQVRLLQAQNDLRDAREELQSYLQGSLEIIRGKLYKFSDQLSQPLPLSQTGLTLDAHINGAQRTITKNHQRFTKQLQKTIADVQTTVHQLTRLTSMDIEAMEVFLAHYSKIRSQSREHESRYEQFLELIAIHNDWVKRVGQIKRLLDYIQIIEKVTDPALLKAEIEDEIVVIEQELSTLGLEQYEFTYHTHSEKVTQITKDVDLAIKAAELVRTITSLPSDASQNPASEKTKILNNRNWLQDWLERDWINLSDIIQQEQCSVDEITNRLVMLFNNDETIIQFRVTHKTK